MTASMQLGNTHVSISTIGLGCWQFSQAKGLVGGYWGELSPATATQIIAASITGGVNWFDTAEAYGNGSSERVLAQGLRMLAIEPQQALIASKWWPTPRLASSIPFSAQRSQKNLGEYPLGLYQVHNPISLSSISAQMKAMSQLVKAGIVRYVGVSNFNAEQMLQAARMLQSEGLQLASNQVRYSLLVRDIESNGVLEAAQELGVSIIAYSPLAQGLLTGRYHVEPALIRARGGFRRFLPAFQPAAIKRTQPLIQELTHVADFHNVTCAQIALAWLIQRNPGRVAVIPGASSASQAEKNAAAMHIKLTPSEIEQLDLSSLTSKISKFIKVVNPVE